MKGNLTNHSYKTNKIEDCGFEVVFPDYSKELKSSNAGQQAYTPMQCYVQPYHAFPYEWTLKDAVFTKDKGKEHRENGRCLKINSTENGILFRKMNLKF